MCEIYIRPIFEILIGTSFSQMSNFRRVKKSHVFVTPVKNYFEFFTCDKYVRILHTCDRFVRMWKSNESVTSVKKAFFSHDPPKIRPLRTRQHGVQWLQTEKPGTKMPNSSFDQNSLLLAQLHTETIKVWEFRSTQFSGSRGNAITRWRMERFTKSELGAKNVKFIDRPEFGLLQISAPFSRRVTGHLRAIIARFPWLVYLASYSNT